MHFIDQTNETLPLIIAKIHEDTDQMIKGREAPFDDNVQSIMDRRMEFKNLTGTPTLISLFLILV